MEKATIFMPGRTAHIMLVRPFHHDEEWSITGRHFYPGLLPRFLFFSLGIITYINGVYEAFVRRVRRGQDSEQRLETGLITVSGEKMCRRMGS
jgi:hypothetical protein